MRRQQVAYAQGRGLSVRRACVLLGVSRSTLSYVPRQAAKDAPVIEAMRALAAQYPRYGYRRIHVFLQRQGQQLGLGRMLRLWQVGCLQVPRKRPRRRVGTAQPRPFAPTAPCQVWAYDFVFDACANGQQLKCLTVVDEYTRQCLAIDVAGSIRSERVIEVLSRLMTQHGVPSTLRSDNGPEFVSTALLRWAEKEALDVALIEPGKPWQNGTAESFNGKFRDECLSMEWFRSRAEARVVIEQWRVHYNQVRPHSSLNYQTPEAFRNTCHQGTPTEANSNNQWP